MQGPTKERWQYLCQLAATEQDPKKFGELMDEILELLDEKERRLTALLLTPDVSDKFQ